MTIGKTIPHTAPSRGNIGLLIIVVSLVEDLPPEAMKLWPRCRRPVRLFLVVLWRYFVVALEGDGDQATG
jgi:hypothetical protein